MENTIKAFANETFGQVRVVVVDGEYFFVANDVCSALGYKNRNDAIQKHVSIEYKKALVYKANRETRLAEMWSGKNYNDIILISEPGMWQLVFGSKLDSAMKFQSWVFETVLPSIRANGGYIDGQENLNDDDREELLSEIKELKKSIDRKDRHIERQKQEISDLEWEIKLSHKYQRNEDPYSCGDWDNWN